jgi:hypothetical protein
MNTDGGYVNPQFSKLEFANLDFLLVSICVHQWFDFYYSNTTCSLTLP